MFGYIWIAGVLIAISVFAAVKYYLNLGKIHREYLKAKALVEDIIISFNRQLRREEQRVEAVESRITGDAGKVSDLLNRLKDLEKSKINLETFEAKLNGLSLNDETLLSRIANLESKLAEISKTNEALKVKVEDLEEELKKNSVTNEVESVPVIQIKREKAIASLTDTELAVLQMLSSEGAMTAPEIKQRLQLSREHTARLMKKLYESGYVEREANRMPFRYSVKKEMEKMLGKT
jgi:DNA-binding Lrp family transcriptional regulator